MKEGRKKEKERKQNKREKERKKEEEFNNFFFYRDHIDHTTNRTVAVENRRLLQVLGDTALTHLSNRGFLPSNKSIHTASDWLRERSQARRGKLVIGVLRPVSMYGYLQANS